MDMYIVPGTASDIFGVNNVDVGDPWDEQTAKISDASKGDWGHDSKIGNEIWCPQLRHSGSDKS